MQTDNGSTMVSCNTAKILIISVLLGCFYVILSNYAPVKQKFTYLIQILTLTYFQHIIMDCISIL